MKKIIITMLFCISAMFGKVDFQTASKDQLIAINGIGVKKAESIIEYRKLNKIQNVDDLEKIKGFGKTLVNKIKQSNM